MKYEIRNTNYEICKMKIFLEKIEKCKKCENCKM